ncbi:diguanylate cyclase/phosphodiesterase with extracellular sensor [Arcobacter nitrofigilis DSM 7299]|uniref:Diguanylate cyclase/phosphodiesterase with extracellular sensor n=1 Tax=Arcobacter nitrofigilis (strain ATCC 33309 / DSM 7299 / CCUG 15893 / LMG 7604 / NCTC 12251 / CI) TaxID=572480 RepID=D5V2Q0_ARCNC|nr:EAL domain-containing protein [Arcobacter nitrofigilis]ADG92482.1 diguanylate cyclase/phosphodiesterase with extracellular sensor [Arcobacter nitrofigilis DSM 7299]
MSLSKQLYLIISAIFFAIFVGNFIISVKNTKEYLEIESANKAQDTATSLGLSLKSLIGDKHDPEIESTIKAIANRGFYKEIRLEDVEISFTNDDLIKNIENINVNKYSSISDVRIDSKYGKIEKSTNDSAFENALDSLDSTSNNEVENNTAKTNTKYIFTPTNEYKDGGNFEVSFKIKINNKIVNAISQIDLNKILVKEDREEKFDYVPQWFINLIQLDMQEKSSEISDGWKNVATIYVSSNAGDAYAKLYDQARGAIIYSLIAFFISFIILVLFLQLILKPLKNIEKLAVNIAHGKFGKINKLPVTTEIKNVAIAMNDMSSKIEGIIKKLNANIENVTKKISQDGLTKLELRQTFETDMKNMFITKTDGYVMSLKIESLAEFAKNNSNSAVDKFIKDFANILQNSNESFEFEIKAFRFFGSEFALIAKNCSEEEIKNLSQYLKVKFDDFSKEVNLTNISNIGVTMFNQIGTIPEMLSAAIEARESAKQIGPNEAVIRDANDLARDMESWRELIFDIIDNSKFDVKYINNEYILTGENEGKLIMQEAFTSAYDKDGEQIPIGTFISIAEKYEKVVDFDKAVVSNVIKHIKENTLEHNISINLSLDSIVDSNFIDWLTMTLQNNNSIASKLVFSITAYGVAKDIEHFKVFAKVVNQYHARIIVKRFESKFIPLGSIKDLNLDFIRLARDYTNGISSDSGKHAFVESMQDLCNLVNIKVMAENVKSDEDLEKVKEIGLHAASR